MMKIVTTIILIIISILTNIEYVNAQFLTWSRNDFRIFKIYNPLSCQGIDTIQITEPDLFKFGINSTTIINDDIYTIGPDNIIRKFNRLTGNFDDIFSLPGNNAIGLADNNQDTLFVMTSSGILYEFDVNNLSFDQSTLGNSIRRFVWFDGVFYASTRDYLISFIKNNPVIIDTLASRPDSIVAFTGIAINVYNCENFSVIISSNLYDEGEPETDLYEYTPATDTLAFLCRGYNILTISEFSTDYDCELLVDADKNDSGGRLLYDFDSPLICSGGRGNVTDSDPYVYSSVGSIDSLVVILETPVPDGIQEILEIPAGSDYTVNGSGTQRITITATTFEAYENALRVMEYVNTSGNLTEGPRQVKIYAYRLDRRSEPAKCYLSVFKGPNAGMNDSLDVCQTDQNHVSMDNLLSSDADPGGIWEPGNTFIPSVAGEFVYHYIVDHDNCPSDTALVHIEVFPAIQLQLPADTTICIDGPVRIDVSPNSAEYTYEWSTGEFGAGINVTSSGVYQVTATNGPCEFTEEIEIQFEEPIISVLPDMIEVCDTLATLRASEQDGLQFLWNTGSTENIIEAITSGQYSVIISRGECVVKDSTFVTLYNLPEIQLGNDTTLCSGILNLYPPDIPDNAIFLWQDGSSGPSQSISTGGLYHVTVAYGPCSDSDSILVHIPQYPPLNLGPDREFCDTIQHELSISEDWDNIVWSSGEIENSLIVLQSGLYTVTVEKDGCIKSDSVQIDIITCITCRLFIPNAVSPNLDNINEKLELFSNCAIQNFEWQIFDRWGSLIYKGLNTVAEWPNSLTAPGTYVYLLSYTDPADEKPKIITGEVTVMK